MFDALAHITPAETLQVAGSLCQMTTAVIAVPIGVVTLRFTRRQNSLTLINAVLACYDGQATAGQPRAGSAPIVTPIRSKQAA